MGLTERPDVKQLSLGFWSRHTYIKENNCRPPFSFYADFNTELIEKSNKLHIKHHPGQILMEGVEEAEKKTGSSKCPFLIFHKQISFCLIVMVLNVYETLGRL